ncbi:MAG: hypothetical protein KA457_06065 [Chitinophagales bacterium]|jgi:hypothetical protein|nr:hypothetical protein [Chitinophagales bacterium]
MFQNNLLLLMVIVTSTLVSCQKEKLITNTKQASLTDVLVKTKIYSNHNSETYYYDSQKRVSKIEFLEDGHSYYFEYTYLSNKVLEYRSNEPKHELEETLPNGTIRLNCTSNPRIYPINSAGFYTGNTSNCNSSSFIYDANGFVYKHTMEMIDFSNEATLNNDGKNIITATNNGFSFGGGKFENNVIYQYIKDSKNTIGNANMGKNYLGKSSENLVKTEEVGLNKTTYSYELDEQQRVISVTMNNSIGAAKTCYSYY